MRYYVQFPAGTGSLILQALEARLRRVTVGYADDSAMVLESSSASADLALPYIKNAFVVIAQSPRGNLDRSIAELVRVAQQAPFPKVPGKTGRFRVMVHIDGSLAPVSPKAKGAIERLIAARTGARLEPRGMCQEYWVVGRDGLKDLLLCVQLPKGPKQPKARGALSRELSAVLVAASRPTPQDVFLDPFGGSGALVAARLEAPVQQVWYSDLDLARHRPSFDRALVEGRRVRLLDEDGLILPSVPDGFIHAIVTDPPWGEHEDIGRPYGDFAEAIGGSFDRVLHPALGRYVILVNRRNASVMASGLAAVGLRPRAGHEILVSGHPATVLVGGRAEELVPRRSDRGHAGVAR